VAALLFTETGADRCISYGLCGRPDTRPLLESL
jgi:hypothetical protein